MSRAKKDELVFKALADGRRREILDILKDEPRTTGDICAHFKKLDRCTVMQHLRVLERAGLVITQKKGRFRWNYLNAVPIRDIYDRWINKYANHSVEVLTRMKHEIERK
ncbi:MAG TPA: helix-turn-helix domain-containing protein [Pyrinomonadaceae bacterium]|nr:helix-turn-helix domain-containing protein [Pyrinomonadaceae bacterium]HMP65316.1 helix-turn-helix domain-containing protein [Pyrinomonadaceae bacterium]